METELYLKIKFEIKSRMKILEYNNENIMNLVKIRNTDLFQFNYNSKDYSILFNSQFIYENLLKKYQSKTGYLIYKQK